MDGRSMGSPGLSIDGINGYANRYILGTYLQCLRRALAGLGPEYSRVFYLGDPLTHPFMGFRLPGQVKKR